METKTDEAILKCKDTCPSLFDLKICQEKNMQYLASIREKISEEMNTSGLTDAEWEATNNLLAFIHWLMGEDEEAMKYTDDVLMRHSENVIALANQMWMYREKGYTGVAEIMDKLKVLGSRRNLVNRAQFEQANAYSRFGPRFYKYAIDLFQEIIDDEETDVENLYLSKFGLALLLKRQFNVYNSFCFEHVSDFEKSAKRAINVIYDVAKNAEIDKFRARGWAILGELIGLLKFQQHTDFSLHHILPTSIQQMTPIEFFEKAYTICKDDVYVLERFARQARNLKDYIKSEMLLRRSLGIRKTAFAHHQLAITLRSVLNSSIIGSRSKYGIRKHSVPEEYRTLKFIVAPRRDLLSYSNDHKTAEILNHLEKSIECSPSNIHAMRDKGLLFRSLGWYDKAIEVFEQAAKGKECAPLQEVRCLEQHALCLIHLASTKPSGVSNKRAVRSLYENAKHLIIQALQKSVYIATNAPLPLKVRFPSIKDMLTMEKHKGAYHCKRNIEVLDHLYQFVAEYGQVLPFYKEISEMTEKDANDPKIMFRKAKKYLRKKDFSNSVLLFDLMEVSSSRLEGRKRKLYFEAYLEDALNTVDQDILHMRFKRAIQFCSKRNFGSSGDTHEFEYDITIQSSDSLKQESSAIHKVFTDMCRLSVSLNNEERTTVRLEPNAPASMMQPSCLIVFVFNEEEDISSDYISMALNWNRQERFGSGIISICPDHVNVPTELQQFPVLYQPKDLVISKLSKDGKHQWIREFFWKSVEQTFPTNH
ncbi:hypothetical protein ACJMK2_038382 [Sinanodonta woodiana]|uniref:Uncharacterized protein n=1 Tax=Sinanodonta woodiana TaxID=1069815 RepID=A0ABD3W8T2_SINWO